MQQNYELNVFFIREVNYSKYCGFYQVNKPMMEFCATLSNNRYNEED